MKYQVVNEKLKIYSCSVFDLTMQQVKNFLDRVDHDAPIGAMKMFYEKKSGRLVLNRDNEDYSEYLAIAEGYLSATNEQRIMIKEKSPESMKETIDLMDSCISCRNTLEKMQMLGHQKNKKLGNPEWVALMNAIIKKCNGDPISLSYAYNYGFIEGKRAERARKRT